MKIKAAVIGVTVTLVLIIPLTPTAFAMEGGLGHPISGATINPYARVVPPEPGFAMGVSEAYYTGTIGGSTVVPIGNNLTLGVDMTASLTS